MGCFRGRGVKGMGCFCRGADTLEMMMEISCTIKNLKNDVSNITLSSSIETIQSSTNELKRKYDAFKTETEEGNSNIVEKNCHARV